jgi:hypothetical protein
MKKMSVMLGLCLLLVASPLLSNDDDVVRWGTIAGVITIPGIDNPVGTTGANIIHSGTFAWSVRQGQASVNLSSGATSFSVEGLVINGTAFTGTPGPVSAVTGTLVCSPETATQKVLDTTPVPLDEHGDATFAGTLQGIPAPCVNPLFLVRIATPTGAAGRWIATGADRSHSFTAAGY